jgi:hypothetical protein
MLLKKAWAFPPGVGVVILFLTENRRETGVSSVDATYWMGQAIRQVTQ